MVELIKNIANVTAGNSAPEKEAFSITGIPFVRAGSLEFLVRGVSINECEKVDEVIAKEKKLKLFPKGSILFAKSGMSAKMGRIYVLPKDAYVVSHLAVISITSENVNNSYVAYYFNYRPPVNLIKDDAYPSISIADIENVEIPLPDLETQNKIVAILDKAKAILDKRNETIKKYDELLRAAFLEMFGDPVVNSKKWKQVELSNICNKITDGTHKTPNYLPEGVKFISAKNILNNSISWKDIKYISVEESETINSRCNPEFEDILLTKSGSLGQPALVDVEFKFTLFESLALIKYDRKVVLPSFLITYLMSDGVGHFYKQRHKGVAVKHLHLVDIRSIPVYIPPFDLQIDFERKYNQIHQLKAKVSQAAYKSSLLLESLFQLAFKGELDFNTAVDLEVLLENDYQFFKENSNSGSIKLLLERLNTNELNENRFYEQQTYDKAKSFVFELIKEGKVKQVFDEKTKKVTLTV